MNWFHPFRSWHPSAVTLPAFAKFPTNDELATEQRRKAFWRAVEQQKAKREPIDYDAGLPIG